MVMRFLLSVLRPNQSKETFRFNGAKLPYFNHTHNCGFPGKRRTERTVEMAVADRWLLRHPNAWEVGAVTPYYWPGRVQEVIDPADGHANVTQRLSLFDIDFYGRNVLCISTVEHIGERRYGLNEQKNPVQAIEKLAAEANRVLITFPTGWNDQLDSYAASGGFSKFGRTRFLVRNEDETWTEARKLSTWRRYGGTDVTWANCVVILEK